MIRKMFTLAAIGATCLTAAGCTSAQAAGPIDLGTATTTYANLVDDLYGTGQENLADEQRTHAVFQRTIAGAGMPP